MGMEIVIIVFLMAVAIGLILLEIFLLPGITVAGIGGGLFAIGGAIYAYTISATTGNVTLLLSALVFAGAFGWLLRKNSFHRVALKTDVDSRLTSTKEMGIKTGDEGITLSRLAPIGKARIKDQVVEAKSVTGDFIDEDTIIVVIRVEGYNVLVSPKDIDYLHLKD